MMGVMDLEEALIVHTGDDREGEQAAAGQKV